MKFDGSAASIWSYLVLGLVLFTGINPSLSTPLLSLLSPSEDPGDVIFHSKCERPKAENPVLSALLHNSMGGGGRCVSNSSGSSYGSSFGVLLGCSLGVPRTSRVLGTLQGSTDIVRATTLTQEPFQYSLLTKP